MSTEATQTLLAWLERTTDGACSLRPFASSEPTHDPENGHPAVPTGDTVADRYALRERIGQGASSVVWRVWDTQLERHVAMKVLHGPRSPRAWARFEAEARLSAKLQHSGIVPVHDLGRLDDGRLWFTMREVRGQTLDAAMEQEDWTRRRVLEAFQRVCETVGYAHAHGVVHRDLKPANIMLGRYGEVLVVDWGLAKSTDATVFEPLAPSEDLTDSGCLSTRVGTVSGTPLYMSPEQAQGRSNEAGPPADVYSLGATLHHLLTGTPPRSAPTVEQLIDAVATGTPLAIPVDEPGLAALLRTALAHDPADRYPHAGALASAIGDWLDGIRKRETALDRIAEADVEREAARRLRAEAQHLQERGDALLSDIASHAPESEKAPAWALQDEASALRITAQRGDLEADRLLHGALRLVPDLPEALERLITKGIEDHRVAIAERDATAARRLEVALSDHAARLPPSHPTGKRARSWLVGDGRLILHTEPSGAQVRLWRFDTCNRRLVPRPDRVLGTTPLDIPLAMGSVLLELSHPGRETVRYPVVIEREGRWDAVPPGATATEPVWLPPRGALRPFEVYVPAGWCTVGGDPRANHPLPESRIWVDGFAVDRFPVTNQEYVDFLNTLVDAGRPDDAERLAPRERHRGDRLSGDCILGRTSDGHFELGRDSEGHPWLPDVPVVLVDRACVDGYLAWRATRDGLVDLPRIARDRRPFGIEMEKAARGVDARYFPWGDVGDPAWACVGSSHAGARKPVSIDAFPTDESVYGVRHVAGNVVTMCEELWVRSTADSDRLDLHFTDAHSSTVDFTARGSSWASALDRGRCATRNRLEDHRATILGFRGARSIGPR